MPEGTQNRLNWITAHVSIKGDTWVVIESGPKEYFGHQRDFPRGTDFSKVQVGQLLRFLPVDMTAERVVTKKRVRDKAIYIDFVEQRAA